MYLLGISEYEHHRKHIGTRKIFGYKDFYTDVPGGKIRCGKVARPFRRGRHRYIMPVAEHHDGFQMYASGLSEWNAAKRNRAGM